MEESKHERMVSTVNLKKLKENFSKDELVQYIAELREEKAANDSFKLSRILGEKPTYSSAIHEKRINRNIWYSGNHRRQKSRK